MPKRQSRTVDPAAGVIGANAGTTSPTQAVGDNVVDRVSATSSVYPGGKGAAGLSERIIRQMPPHVLYVEGFAGHAAVFRKKRSAGHTILIDADPKVCEWLREQTIGRTDVEVVCASFLDYMVSMRWNVTANTLIYLDPPYLRSVRTCLLYDFEFHSEEEHTALLHLAASLPCMVMVSGYDSPLYRSMLQTWRLETIPAMTRGGMRLEHLWCNFGVPELLHDSRFAGADYRQRENYKRRSKRWAKKFAGMDRGERQVVAAALVEHDRSAVEMALRSAPAQPPMVDRDKPKL